MLSTVQWFPFNELSFSTEIEFFEGMILYKHFAVLEIVEIANTDFLSINRKANIE
ncbi:MAG: hypothetical protein ABIS36_20420 [Chryseolinea sp.]